MALYTAPTVSGYNPSAPPNDGSQVASNLVDWDKHISDIGDPINNFAADINSATGAAFGKVFPNGVTSTSSGFTAAAGDWGTLFAVSGTSTVALPASATATAGYILGVHNAGTGVVTVDGDGSETINGDTTIDLPPDFSALLVADGSNWTGLIMGQEWRRLQADVTPSSVTEQDVTWNSTVKDIRILWRKVAPATDNANFALQLKQGGAIVTSSNYQFHLTDPSSSASTYLGLGSASTDEILLSGNVGSGTNEITTGELTITDVQGTGTHVLFWKGVGVNGSGVVAQAEGAGRLDTTGALEGARLKFDSGNITSGTIELWGRY